jgi:hypothetical protein
MTLARGARQILIHGSALVLAGLLWGFGVPLTPYPRLALGAHVQFVTNGMLIMLLAVVLLKLPHRVGSRSLWVMVVAAWLVWPMALSEAANACWGANRCFPWPPRRPGRRGPRRGRKRC